MTTARHHLPPLWVMVLGARRRRRQPAHRHGQCPPAGPDDRRRPRRLQRRHGGAHHAAGAVHGGLRPRRPSGLGAHRGGGCRRGGSRLPRAGHRAAPVRGVRVAAVCRDVPCRRGDRRGRDPAPRPGQGALPAAPLRPRDRAVHVRHDGRGHRLIGPGRAADAGAGQLAGVAGLVGPAGRRRTGRVVPGGPRGWALPRRQPSRRHRPPPPLAARHGLARRRVPLHPVVAVLLLARLAGPHLRRAGLEPHPRGLPAVGLLLRPGGLGPARPRADRPGPRPPAASARRRLPRSGRPARPVAGTHSGALAVGRASSASARGRPSPSPWSCWSTTAPHRRAAAAWPAWRSS